MTKIQELESKVASLSQEELSEFRRWFAEFDADAWDEQFESDVKAGKLDQLGEKALREHAEGRTTDL